MRNIGLFVCFIASTLVARAQTYSVNAVGYYTVNTSPGFYMVANNLNYKGNHVDDVLPLPDWATGSELHKFDGQNQRYHETMVYVAGLGWLTAGGVAPVLHPGEGAFLKVISNGAPAAITLTFVGDVPPRPCRTIYAGYNQWSPSLGGDMAESSPVDGDTIFQFWPIMQTYREAWTYLESFGWLSSHDPDIRGPRLAAGESVFLYTTVTRNPCVIEGIPAPLGGVVILNPSRSGSSFSFDFASETGRTYQVQSKDLYPSGPWNNTGAPIAGTGQTITFFDSTASGPARYYRLIY